MVGGYSPGVMRVGYTPNGAIFVNFRGESITDNLVNVRGGPFADIYESGWADLWHISELWGWVLPRPMYNRQSDCGPWCIVRHGPQCRPLLVTQIFRDKASQPLKYESQYAYSLHRHPAVCSGNVLAMGDVLLDISSLDELSVCQTIPILWTSSTDILSTAFHLPGGLMSCLATQPSTQLGTTNGIPFELQLYCVQKNEHLASTTFESGVHWSPYIKYPGPFVLFDPSPTPTYLVALLLEIAREEESTARKKDCSSERQLNSLCVWVFDYPSLKLTKSFKVPRYGRRSFQNDKIATLNCYFSSSINKLVCCEERRVPVNCCQLWIIDIKEEKGTIQYLPGFRRLSFVQSMEIVVSMSVRGWIQFKKIEEMEQEMTKFAGVKNVFEGGIDSWVLQHWKKLAYVPRKFSPCFESGIAVRPEGRVAYVAEFDKRIVEIAFAW